MTCSLRLFFFFFSSAVSMRPHARLRVVVNLVEIHCEIRELAAILFRLEKGKRGAPIASIAGAVSRPFPPKSKTYRGKSR